MFLLAAEGGKDSTVGQQTAQERSGPRSVPKTIATSLLAIVLIGGLLAIGGELLGSDPSAVLQHEDGVMSAAFSPDGSQVVTGTYDAEVVLWSAQTGERLQVSRGHRDQVSSVAFSPDESLVASGSYDATVRLWSAETGRQVQVLNHEDDVESVAFSPDGSFLATGDFSQELRLWSVRTGEQLWTSRSSKISVGSIAFSPDGSLILTGGDDGTARLLSTKTGNEIRRVRGRANDGVNGAISVAFSPNGSLMATGTWDNTPLMYEGVESGIVELWRTESGRPAEVLEGHTDGIKSVAFSPTGEFLLTGSIDGTARLWSTQTGEEIQVLSKPLLGYVGYEDYSVPSVAFSPNQSLVATVESDKVKLWPVAPRQ